MGSDVSATAKIKRNAGRLCWLDPPTLIALANEVIQ
jgi:hypothetical protein